MVPLKRLSEAKSRLAPSLDRAERAELAMTMVRRVVGAVRESGVVGRLALVTPEPHIARGLGAETLPDAGDLNASLQTAVGWAAGSAGLLILPADLPLISPADVRALIAAPGIVVAETQDGGTGALLLRPPDAFPPHFGPDSFVIHRRLAFERGLDVSQVRLTGVSFDLDTVDDLGRLQTLHR
ncbi:MAG TPA: 2-phospho-L-lactate guanylyltransferase [Chloroflexota bacterium]|nr:2-phospho-L-lactate guanylyltransferase [Chloroflexota bacterium]